MVFDETSSLRGEKAMTERNERENSIRFLLTPRAQNALIVMTAMMSVAIIVANYVAVKIWNLGGIPVDGGLLLFPLTYVLGDVLSEIYGKKTADTVAWSSSVIGIMTVLLMIAVWWLPDYAGADNTAFKVVASLTERIFCASILGFLVSQICNNLVFEKIRQRQLSQNTSNMETMRQFGWRAFASSAVAHVPDILIFEPLAFWGRLSVGEFLTQAVFAYIAAVIVEVVLLCFVTVPLVNRLARWLGFRHGERL